MRTFHVRNAQQALPTILGALFRDGHERASRNGPVLLFPEPCAIVYSHPCERVLFWAQRDANPFFHFFESLWLLAGHNDVKFPAQFAKNIANYSDDGKTLHDAYGHRWRHHFRRDQIKVAIEMLKTDPDSRRVVLTMWDPLCDLYRVSKSLPCNTHIYFSVSVDGKLDMTVCNRSNDLVWGALGANVVHMSYLQEYIAAALGRPVGIYTQFSNNLHGYLATIEPLRDLAVDMSDLKVDGLNMSDPYFLGEVRPRPLFEQNNPNLPADTALWDRDLNLFLEAGIPAYGYENSFFSRVAKPLLAGHQSFKAKDWEAARDNVSQCKATDWRRAALEWLDRREAKDKE